MPKSRASLRYGSGAARGQEECRTVWADEAGVLLAGETTSATSLTPSQPEGPGPVGQKGFLMALDTALDLQWSFAFQGDPLAPLGTPSSVAIRDVVRDPADSLMAWVLFDAPREGKWEGHLMGVHAEEGMVAEHHLTAPGAAFTAALTPVGGGAFLVVGHTVPTAAPGPPAGIQVGLWTGKRTRPRAGRSWRARLAWRHWTPIGTMTRSTWPSIAPTSQRHPARYWPSPWTTATRS